MKSILSAKMLASLALVLLVFSASEGRILSKCELKAKLEAARLQEIKVTGEKLDVKDLVARCELLFFQIPFFSCSVFTCHISMSHDVF